MTYARPSGAAPAADSSLTPKTAVSTAIGQHTFKTCSWADGPQPSGDDVWPREPALTACSGGRSLSVSGVARQRKPVGRGWFFAGGWAWPTEPGSRWSGRSVAGTPTLTLARVATGCSSEEPAWVTAWASPHPARPEMDGREGDARVSSLISVLGPGSGDMMGDRVPATGGRGRSFYGGRPQGVCQTAPRGDRSIGEPAAPHQRSRSTQAHTIADQVRRRLAARRGPTPGRRVLAGCGRPRGPACGPPTARPACHQGAG
jgi:hypothetical protein